MSGSALRMRAGAAAHREIRAHGFSLECVQTLAGASGGAKWLVLSRLDRVLAASLLNERRERLHLVGSSIGAWRFACYAQADPVGALERFEAAYIDQHYDARPTAREVSARTREILAAVLGGAGTTEILAHPVARLHVIAVLSRGLAAAARPALLLPTLLAAAAANAVSRRALGWFFKRALFYDPRDVPPFFDIEDLPTERIALSAGNLADAIVASGSIPLVLDGVRDIAGAPPGVYRDGGVIDYHFDMPFCDNDHLALYPHFYGHVAPGWFDKRWPHRRARAQSLDRVLLLHPAEEFVARLPGGKIPDRYDFVNLGTSERLRIWNGVVNECERLADEWLEAVEKERIPALIEAL